MKHYGFSAAEAIGWMRVCRPGSVIGPQQQYLKQMERAMHREGSAFRRRTGASSSAVRQRVALANDSIFKPLFRPKEEGWGGAFV